MANVMARIAIKRAISTLFGHIGLEARVGQRIAEDPDVQRLIWDSYMNKRLKRSDPLAHLRVFAKDMAHLLRLVSP